MRKFFQNSALVVLSVFVMNLFIQLLIWKNWGSGAGGIITGPISFLIQISITLGLILIFWLVKTVQNRIFFTVIAILINIISAMMLTPTDGSDTPWERFIKLLS